MGWNIGAAQNGGWDIGAAQDAASGAATITGTGSAALASVAAAGTGVAYTVITGTGSSALAAIASVGSGTAYTVITGTGSSALAAIASAGTGTAYTVITGTGSAALAAITSVGSGTAYTAITGTGTSALAAITSAGVGVVNTTVTGTGAAALAAVAATGTGTAGEAHVFDLVAQPAMAPHVCMWDLSWFGVPSTDAWTGVDYNYGNWDLANYHALDPDNYPAVPYATHDPSLCAMYYDVRARQIASYFRPLVGLYSSSGQTATSLAKRDLDLSLLRDGSDPRGRCDCWAVEMGHYPQTQAGGATPGDSDYLAASDYRYQGLVATLARAEAAGIVGVTIAYNAQFVGTLGYATEAIEQAAIETDLATYIALLIASSAGYRVDGRVLIYLWTGTESNYTPAEWHTLLESVRRTLAHDFYVVARYRGGGVYDYADGCYPWVSGTDYDAATGATERLKAEDWTRLRHDQILTEAATYSGRIVVGSLFPGFEDWAKGFGQGLDRDVPRSEDLVQGQIDRFLTDGITAVQCGTWNDYPEGSQWEPTLQLPDDSEDAQELRWLTEGLARLYSESVVTAETTALKQSWLDYVGQTCADVDIEGAGSRPIAATVSAALTSAHHRSPVASRRKDTRTPTGAHT